MMIVPFYVDFGKYDEDHNLVYRGTSYIVAAGRDYNEAALTALEICATRPNQIPIEIREDL